MSANYKIERDMTGEKFIENLEKINKKRISEKPAQADDVHVAAARVEENTDEVVLDLNPKKQKKTDNLYMDLMALYSRASVNDKKGGAGQTRSQRLAGAGKK